MSKKWLKGKDSWNDPSRPPSRRGRPSNTFTASLRNKPTKAMWDGLVAACINAIVTQENCVYLAFNYLTTWPDDFPRGFVVERSGYTDVHKIRAKTLLTWLNNNGYTSIDNYDLQQQQRSVTMLSRGIDEMFEKEYIEENTSNGN